MKKPDIIICPAGCGYIRVNRKQKRCPGCKIKLFYTNDTIVPIDKEDLSGFIWLKTEWVNVEKWLTEKNVFIPQ